MAGHFDWEVIMSVMEMEQQPVRVRRLFTDEFKRDAVFLVLDAWRRTVDVASSLGIRDGTLVMEGRPRSGSTKPCRPGPPTWSRATLPPAISEVKKTVPFERRYRSP
jgi:transposase-like protein